MVAISPYRSNSSYGGKGGYSTGTLTLTQKTTIYIYVGGSGNSVTSASNSIYPGGFNGGGYRYNYKGGGGATDIRIGSASLYARVIVAGGGGVYAKSYNNSNLPGTKFCRPDYSIVTSILTSNTSSTSSPAPVQPSYTAWVGSCTANGTDVFSGATGATKLSTYPKLNAGNLVDIIGESGTRYQVRIAAKYIGYVEKSNIKNPNTPAATTTKKYPFVGKVTASKLNVRKKPGTEHPLLPEYPMLNKDNLINVLGVTKDTKGDRWYKVSITKKEYVGYVSAKYIIKA